VHLTAAAVLGIVFLMAKTSTVIELAITRLLLVATLVKGFVLPGVLLMVRLGVIQGSQGYLMLPCHHAMVCSGMPALLQ
jgi:hypothetical protein